MRCALSKPVLFLISMQRRWNDLLFGTAIQFKTTVFIIVFYTSMSKGGGGAGCHHPQPNRFSKFSFRMGRTFVPNQIFCCNFILGTCVHEIFFGWDYRLGSKLDEGRVLKVTPSMDFFSTYFSNYKDGIHS